MKRNLMKSMHIKFWHRLVAVTACCGVIASVFSLSLSAIADTANADSTASATSSYLMKVDFSDGTAKDQTGNTTAQTQGTAKVVYDSTIKHNVLDLTGNDAYLQTDTSKTSDANASYVNYPLTSGQYQQITNSFTIELVFSVASSSSVSYSVQEFPFSTLIQGGNGIKVVSSGAPASASTSWTNTTMTSMGTSASHSYSNLSYTIQPNRYYYETLIYDGQNINLYIDGTLVQQTPTTGPVYYNTSAALCLGAKPIGGTGTSNPFSGKIAYASVQTNSISAQQVQSNYNSFFDISGSSSTGSSSTGSSSTGSSSTGSSSTGSSSADSSSADSSSADTNITVAGDVKVGTISDLHLLDNTTSASANAERLMHLQNALTTFKQQGVQLIVINGDLADTAQSGAYELLAQTFNSIFTDSATAPKVLATMGNHDYYLDKSGVTDDAERSIFVNEMNKKGAGFKTVDINNGSDSVNNAIIINGYYFIGVSTESSAAAGLYTSTATNYLSAQLAAANAADPNKPIFVFAHQPMQNTVIASSPYSPLNGMYAVMKNYPQVINYSGHTHTAVEDERDIYQQDFTTVNDGALLCMYQMPGSNDYSHQYDFATGLITTIKSSQVSIQRYDFHNNESVKNPWTLNAPYNDPTKFTYTASRIGGSAPSFDATASIKVTDTRYDALTVTFDAAKDDDFVYGYEVVAVDRATGAKVSDVFNLSDFYYNFNHMSATPSRTILGLQKGHTYDISVYAYDSYGVNLSGSLNTTAASKPLTITASTDADSTLTSLQTAVNHADTLQQGDYTASSWSPFASALNIASGLTDGKVYSLVNASTVAFHNGTVGMMSVPSPSRVGEDQTAIVLIPKGNGYYQLYVPYVGLYLVADSAASTVNQKTVYKALLAADGSFGADNGLWQLDSSNHVSPKLYAGYYLTQNGNLTDTSYDTIDCEQGIAGTAMTLESESSFSTGQNRTYDYGATYGTALATAMQNLVSLASITESLINAIGTVHATDTSSAAITLARASFNALTPSQQAQVTNYATLTAAENAYANLIAGFTNLNTLIGSVSGYDSTRYTPQSWKTFADTLAGAKALQRDTASQQDVDNAYAALQSAVNGLTPTETGGGTSSSAASSVSGTTSAASSAVSLSSSSSGSSVTLANSSTDVQVIAPTGAIPAGTTLEVIAVTSGTTYNTAAMALADVGDQFSVYSITLVSNNVVIEPDGTVTVKLPIPAGYDTSRLAVYRIGSDGTRTKLDGNVSGNNYIFTTDHFSTYALVQTTAFSTSSTTSSTASSSSSGTASASNPDTGRKEEQFPIVILVSVGLLGAAFLLIQRKPFVRRK